MWLGWRSSGGELGLPSFFMIHGWYAEVFLPPLFLEVAGAHEPDFGSARSPSDETCFMNRLIEVVPYTAPSIVDLVKKKS